MKFSLRDLSFAFCDLSFAVAAFIVFIDFGAFIVVAFGAIVTFFAFIENGAYALLRKLRSMSHNGFGRTCSGAVDLRTIDSISQLAELKAYNVCGARIVCIFAIQV